MCRRVQIFVPLNRLPLLAIENEKQDFNHLLFNDDDDSGINFNIKPTSRRRHKNKQCRGVLLCKRKINRVNKNSKLNRRLNRVGRPIAKWVLTK